MTRQPTDKHTVKAFSLSTYPCLYLEKRLTVFMALLSRETKDTRGCFVRLMA